MIGDVAGHGLRAAVVMGRVKSALRAFTLVADRPGEVLELTDRKVQLFEFGTIITVACATAVPPYDRFEVCSAGHLPPIVAAAGQPARLVELDLRPPLGVLRDLRRDRGVLWVYSDHKTPRSVQPAGASAA